MAVVEFKLDYLLMDDRTILKNGMKSGRSKWFNYAKVSFMKDPK